MSHKCVEIVFRTDDERWQCDDDDDRSTICVWFYYFVFIQAFFDT